MNTDYLNTAFLDALKSMNVTSGFNLFFEEPKNPEHGDLSTNVAMQLAKQLKMPPRKIAESILENIIIDEENIEKIDIAGAGFINVKFKNFYYQKNFEAAAKTGENFGRNSYGNNKKVNVEYVSANPTGMLHMGHGRNACIGDTVANLFEWNGFDVTREYYFNNAGNQMNNLGKSVYARYMQKIDSEDFPFPEDGYHGAYIIQIAEELADKHGRDLTTGDENSLKICREFGEKPEVTSMSVQEDDLLSIGRVMNEIIETEKALGSEIAIDITPGRKAMTAGAIMATRRTKVDHIFYLYLKDLDMRDRLFMHVPLSEQNVHDFVEEEKMLRD